MTPLKHAIVDASLRQYEVAQLAKLTETRLSRLATGRATPTIDERRRLAKILGVPEVQLFRPAT